MAEYIKFRLTSAKIGVTMALAALIAGIAEKAHSGSPSVTARPAALFIKLNGITGPVHDVLAKIEAKMTKIETQLTSLDKKLHTEYYNKAQTGKIYMKIKKAEAEFLRKDQTAVNAAKLDNLDSSSFVQGNHASVISGALGNLTQSSQQLLSLPGGIIAVRVANIPGAGQIIAIHNGSQGSLVGIADGVPSPGPGPTELNLKANSDTLLPAVKAPADVRIQIFPGGVFTDVVSILIGLTPNPSSQQQIEAVAQAFTGGV